MAEIIDNEKLPWPSRLADFSYHYVKWGLFITAIAVLSGLILQSINQFYLSIASIGFAIGLCSLFIGLTLSTIALLGILFYRFKIYGAKRAFGVFLLTLTGSVMGWAIVQPALFKAKLVAEHVYCEKHLKGLSNAVRMYTYENDGHYPSPEQWSELILKNPGGFNEKAFWCRVEPKGTFSYAINKYLYQIEPNDVSSEMVLLFEADLGPNGIGDSDDVVLRHKQDSKLGCYISFADGHVEFVKAEDIPNLRWTVEE